MSAPSRRCSALLLAVFALLSAARLRAQAPAAPPPATVHLTLPEAIQMALAHNRRLALAQLAVRESAEGRRIAEAHLYPVLDNHSLLSHITELEGVVIPPGALSQGNAGSPVPPQTVTIDQGSTTSYASITQLAQPITQLFELHAGVQAASAELRSTELQALDARNGTILGVEQLYFNILIEGGRGVAAAAAEQASETAQQESTRAVNDGKALADSELSARVDTLQKQQNTLVSRLNLDDLTLQLDDALGLPLGTHLDLDPDSTGAPAALPTREEAIAQVLATNPSVLAARQVVGKARAGLAVAHDAYIPEISGVARYDYQSGIPLLKHNFGTFGGNFSYTLFDGGAREAKVKQAHIRLSEAETQLVDTENKIRIEVSSAYDKTEQLAQLVEVATEAVAAREESLRIQSKRLELHAELASGVAAARAALAGANVDLLSARLHLLLAQQDIKRLLGQAPG